MKKTKKFLNPITLVALAVLTTLTGNATDIDKNRTEESSSARSDLDKELIKIQNYRKRITSAQFLAPVDKVLLTAVLKNPSGMTFFHRSHYSHQSHSSHRSHYSSSW